MQSRQDYINSLYRSAKQAVGDSGIFPETIITQHILESGYTPSQLATKANNFFGIKSSLDWTGKVISLSTSEYVDGVKKTYPGTGKIYNNRIEALKDGANVYTMFRYYPNQTEGIKGYVDFITKNPRYKKAGVLDAKTIQDQFSGLVKAGYATDPQYLDKLVKIYTQIKVFFFSKRFRPLALFLSKS